MRHKWKAPITAALVWGIAAMMLLAAGGVFAMSLSVAARNTRDLLHEHAR